MVTDIGGSIVDDEDAVMTWMDGICEDEELASGSAWSFEDGAGGDGSVPKCDEELPDLLCEPSPLGPPLAMLFTGVSTTGLSKAGGAPCSSSSRCRRASWAAASASSPYGNPNFPKLSLDDKNVICCGVGPAFGKENSVRVRVWVSGGDMTSEVDEAAF